MRFSRALPDSLSSYSLRLRRVVSRLTPASATRRRWRRREEPLEPRVRRVVAEHLGVGGEDLTPEVSLVDDLAADSLDVLDLMLAFEEELHVAIPEPVIDQIRTYGELVEAMQATVRARRAKEARREASRAPALVWVEIAPPPSSAHGGIAHGGWLTPYTAETILQNALRAGPGTRVEVGVPSNLSESAVADIADGFACLGARAVDVCVRRDPALPPVGAAA